MEEEKMASKLTEEQLMLLDSLIYLKWEKINKNKPTIRDVIQYAKDKPFNFWEENKETKIVGSYNPVEIKNYHCFMNEYEWIKKERKLYILIA